MTPDTGMDSVNGDQNINNTLVAQSVAAVIDKVYKMTDYDSILVTHSQGGLLNDLMISKKSNNIMYFCLIIFRNWSIFIFINNLFLFII